MSIYVNRILNLRKIKAIGLDMDHTLVRYHSIKFEQLTFKEVIKKLIKIKGYPKEISRIRFNYSQVIRGLVIDKANGNLIKTSLYGRVKKASHGLRQLSMKELNSIYRGLFIDLNDENFHAVDTLFSIGEAVIFANLVDLKDRSRSDSKFPSYMQMALDIREVLDLSHRDDSIKKEVVNNLREYIIRDEKVVKLLERWKRDGHMLMIITNSDYEYTKVLLDYTMNKYLKEYESWWHLFDYVITSAEKPHFFSHKKKFLRINENNATMTNVKGDLSPGTYQGGDAHTLEKELGLNSEQILYFGDHIFGDVLSLKKNCHWRTALVIEELDDEVKTLNRNRNVIKRIDNYMEKKREIELEISAIKGQKKEHKSQVSKKLEQMKKLDEKLTKIILEYESKFNKPWGELMRAGQEESGLMGQIIKYACIYMAKINELEKYSSRHYFRPKRRSLPHEL